MSKNYRGKEACLAEAERLGIPDADRLSWPELQRAVSKALKLEEMGVSEVQGDDEPEMVKQRRMTPDQQMMLPYIGKTIVISPEMKPERYRLLKYDEVIGNDYEVVERKFDIDDKTGVYDVSGDLGSRNTIDQYHDYLTGTYRLKKRNDNKVVAMSSVPKENSGMIFRPGIDLVTVVTWQGRSGYLWKHMWLPNVRALLMECGYYNEYKDLFVDEPNVWYAAGKQLVCDPHLVHRVFHEIEQKEKLKREKGEWW